MKKLKLKKLLSTALAGVLILASAFSLAGLSAGEQQGGIGLKCYTVSADSPSSEEETIVDIEGVNLVTLSANGYEFYNSKNPPTVDIAHYGTEPDYEYNDFQATYSYVLKVDFSTCDIEDIEMLKSFTLTLSDFYVWSEESDSAEFSALSKIEAPEGLESFNVKEENGGFTVTFNADGRALEDYNFEARWILSGDIAGNIVLVDFNIEGNVVLENEVTSNAKIVKELVATVYPTNAKNKEVDWDIEWEDKTVEDNVIDYANIIPAEDGSNVAYLEVYKAFRGKNILIYCTTRQGGYSAKCKVIFEGLPEDMTVSDAEGNSIEKGAKLDVYTGEQLTLNLNSLNRFNDVTDNVNYSVKKGTLYAKKDVRIYYSTGNDPIEEKTFNDTEANGNATYAYSNSIGKNADFTFNYTDFLNVKIEGNVLTIDIKDISQATQRKIGSRDIIIAEMTIDTTADYYFTLTLTNGVGEFEIVVYPGIGTEGVDINGPSQI